MQVQKVAIEQHEDWLDFVRAPPDSIAHESGFGGWTGWRVDCIDIDPGLGFQWETHLAMGRASASLATVKHDGSGCRVYGVSTKIRSPTGHCAKQRRGPSLPEETRDDWRGESTIESFGMMRREAANDRIKRKLEIKKTGQGAYGQNGTNESPTSESEPRRDRCGRD